MPPVTAICTPSVMGGRPELRQALAASTKAQVTPIKTTVRPAARTDVMASNKAWDIVQKKAAVWLALGLHPTFGTQHLYHVHQTAVRPLEVARKQSQNDRTLTAGGAKPLRETCRGRLSIQLWRQDAVGPALITSGSAGSKNHWRDVFCDAIRLNIAPTKRFDRHGRNVLPTAQTFCISRRPAQESAPLPVERAPLELKPKHPQSQTIERFLVTVTPLIPDKISDVVPQGNTLRRTRGRHNIFQRRPAV